MEAIEMVKIYRVLGSTEEITTCDCCGKSNLKKTVIMGVLNTEGEVESECYFGVVCASRNAGRKAKEIRREMIEADERKKRLAAKDIVEQVKNMVVPTPVVSYCKFDGKSDSGIRVSIGDQTYKIYRLALLGNGLENEIKSRIKSWKDSECLKVGQKFGFKTAYEIRERARGTY